MDHSDPLDQDESASQEYDRFRQARAALDRGDVAGLDALLTAHPSLVSYRCTRSELDSDGNELYARGYFRGATLLHHVAGNPTRQPLPANIADIARVLLAHGADANAVCGEPGHEGTTAGLVLSSRFASEAGVAVPLLELLRAAGAPVDFDDPELLTTPLWNHARGTAEALVARGTKMDIRHAAALGRLDTLKARLAEGVDRALLEEALIMAVVQRELPSVRLLVEHGATGDRLAPPAWSGSLRGRATALHEAAARGFTEIVALLLEHGANPHVIDRQFGGTPAGWAEYEGAGDEILTLLKARMAAVPPPDGGASTPDATPSSGA